MSSLVLIAAVIFILGCCATYAEESKAADRRRKEKEKEKEKKRRRQRRNRKK